MFAVRKRRSIIIKIDLAFILHPRVPYIRKILNQKSKSILNHVKHKGRAEKAQRGEKNSSGQRVQSKK